MSLILTHISRHGIIHASDSNLTTSNDENGGEGQKTFSVDFLNAGLTIAGAYSVNGIWMDEWMPEFIKRQSQSNVPNLKEFSHNLKDALQSEMTPNEKESGSLIHIAGYVREYGFSHAELWFVRNIFGIDGTTGDYTDFRDEFGISEDFWSRDYVFFKDKIQLPSHYANMVYVNGLLHGRHALNEIRKKLDEFFEEFWRNKDYKFRHPQSLEEYELIVKLYMQVIDTLFVMSDYKAKYIGGKTQTLLIPQPNDIVDKIR